MTVFQPINRYYDVEITLFSYLQLYHKSYRFRAFYFFNSFTNLAQDQILILILKCTCILKKLTLQPSFPVYLPFLFSADLSNQLILSKDATETEEGLKIRISFGTAFICILGFQLFA